MDSEMCIKGSHRGVPIPTSTVQAINFAARLALFDDHWQPRMIAQMNDYQLRPVKIEGDFVWYSHADTDETFIVLAGRLRIDFCDGAVHLDPGEVYAMPRGVEHKSLAEDEMRILLVEPYSAHSTGDQSGERTAVNDLWI